MCWLFHKWGKWEVYIQKGTITCASLLYPKELRGREIPFTEYRQRKVCKRCGFTKDRLIREE